MHHKPYIHLLFGPIEILQDFYTVLAAGCPAHITVLSPLKQASDIFTYLTAPALPCQDILLPIVQEEVSVLRMLLVSDEQYQQHYAQGYSISLTPIYDSESYLAADTCATTPLQVLEALKTGFTQPLIDGTVVYQSPLSSEETFNILSEVLLLEPAGRCHLAGTIHCSDGVFYFENIHNNLICIPGLERNALRLYGSGWHSHRTPEVLMGAHRSKTKLPEQLIIHLQRQALPL